MGPCQRLGVGGGFQNGKYGRHLSAKNPKWAAQLIGRKIYQYTMVIMRGYGTDSKGRKINSRKTTGEECETALGGKGDWKSIAVSRRWLIMKDGAMSRVIASPYGIFVILMEANRPQKQPMMKLIIGPTGKTGSYATLSIMAQTIGGIVGKRPMD